MEYIILIWSVTLIHLLAVMSPGPDFIVAVKNSLSYSRRTGLWTAVGFWLGISVHIAYCLAWIALIISQSILLFQIIKFIGAAYLIYLWIWAIRAKSWHIDIQAETQKEDISALEAVKIWFLTNVLNPKATLFFLSLFTLVISPDTPAFILGIISLIMIVNTTLWFSIVALLFTHKKVQNIFEKFQNSFNKILWGMLIALWIKVALTQK